MLKKAVISPNVQTKLLLALATLAGCSSPQLPAPVVTSTTLPTAVAAPIIAQPVIPDTDLASYALKLKALGPQSIQAEVAQLRQQSREAPTYVNRLRLAMALWISNGDDLEIQTLADSSQAAAADSPLRGIGLLLASISAERRRNRELVTTSHSRSQEARRSQESQQARLEALQRQIDELERKLAALREMEKSLIQRP
ncbi:MAG: hypothetical protein JNM76_18005 [Betaproteobacteria bacterium]|nr:hypothetical protein [Betaproteobacteria bacterium]